MESILYIVFGCLIAIAIFCAAAYFFLKHAIRSFTDSLNDDHSPILAIHLHEDLVADWIEERQATSIVDEFLSHGFIANKAYTIEEMPQIKVLSLFHEQFVGMLYQLDQKTCFFEMVHMSSEDDTLTITTLPTAEQYSEKPGKKKFYLAQGSVADVLAAITEKTKGQPTFSITPENLRETVERYYREEQAFMNNNGGMSFEDFRFHSRQESERLSEDKLQPLFIELKTQELENWNSAALHEIYETETFNDNELNSGGCCFIVPKKANAEAFVHYLNSYDMVLDEHVEKIIADVRNEEDIQALFERMNSSRSPELRAKLLGELLLPVDARVYQMAA